MEPVNDAGPSDPAPAGPLQGSMDPGGARSAQPPNGERSSGRPPLDRILLALFAVAALGALLLGFGPALGTHCPSCSGGLLSLCLPWAGVAFYGLLAILAWRTPGSGLLLLAPGFYLFMHANLVTEMMLTRRMCAWCLMVAAAAVGAGIRQSFTNRSLGPTAALALVLGVTAGFFSPFDRTDDLLTRKLWPARKLESAPPWVSREEMSRCEHRSALRLLIFEKDCKS